MSKQSEIREQVTQKIIAALERDLLPWRRMWATSGPGRHTNVTSKKPYTGVNPLLLEIHAALHGFRSQWWGTFNQWHQLGCMIKRRPDGVDAGQWGCGIAVYIPVTKKAADPDDQDEEEEEKFWVLKKFTLFNAEQVNGLRAKLCQLSEMPANTADIQPDYEPAEQLIQATGAEIRCGEHPVYKLPIPEGSWPNHIDGDYIQMPPKSSFAGGAYYTTALHELAHYSEVRLGWDRNENNYAMGELVAEIASCFLATELGIPNSESVDNHAAYIKTWLSAMKNDKNYIFTASRQASKVCDFMLSFVRQSEIEPKPELVEAA